MTPLLLDCIQIAKLRQAVADKNARALAALPFECVSVGALVELCCIHHAWCRSEDDMGITAFKRLAGALPVVEWAYNLFVNCLQRPERSGFQATESAFVLTAVAREGCFQGTAWSDFQQAFVRRLKTCGFDPGFANALSAAFCEIVENVPDHSGELGGEMAPAMLGYLAVPGEVHFAVADLGRGLLASLHENPLWAGLKNSHDAIAATIEQGATRKREHMQGEGFKLALKSFVDRNGILFASSGDATAKVGLDSQGRHVDYGFAPFLPGTRIAASCFARGAPAEKPTPKLFR